jgi:hypothetical protein
MTDQSVIFKMKLPQPPSIGRDAAYHTKINGEFFVTPITSADIEAR